MLSVIIAKCLVFDFTAVINIASIEELTQYVDFLAKKWPNLRQMWRLFASGKSVGYLQLKKSGKPKKFNFKSWDAFNWKGRKAQFGRAPEKLNEVFYWLRKKLKDGNGLSTFDIEKTGNKFIITDNETK